MIITDDVREGVKRFSLVFPFNWPPVGAAF